MICICYNNTNANLCKYNKLKFFLRHSSVYLNKCFYIENNKWILILKKYQTSGSGLPETFSHTKIWICYLSSSFRPIFMKVGYMFTINVSIRKNNFHLRKHNASRVINFKSMWLYRPTDSQPLSGFSPNFYTSLYFRW